MTRFADPGRCPDCGSPIPPLAPACPACGLSLQGPVARDLFLTLTRADQLLATLRAATAPAAAAPAPAAAAAAAAPAPAGPEPLPRLRRGLSGASVPRILLALGALCLLVAALVFLAVTWSVLGVGGRTAALVLLTGVAAALTARSARHALRAATEALGLVSLGLLTLDVVGARHAGWLGDPSPEAFRILLGAVLLAASGAAVLAVRRTPAGALVSGEVVAGGATFLVAEGIGATGVGSGSAALVLATLVAAGVTVGLHLLRLRVAAVAAGVVTLVAWLALTATGLARAAEHPDLSGLWGHAEVWPLLVAAALVAALAPVRALPREVRVTGAGAGYLLLNVAVAAPALDETATVQTLTALAALVVAAGVTLLVPRTWRYLPVGVQAVAGAGAAMATTLVTGIAADRLLTAARDPWTAAATTRLPAATGDTSVPAGWLLPLCVLALAGTAVVLLRASGGALPRRPGPAAITLALLTTVVTLASYPVPLALLVAVGLVVAAGATVAALGQDEPVLLAPAGVALVLALVPALPAEWLTLVAVAGTLLLAAAVQLRAADVRVATGAGLLAAVALAATVGTTGALLDADATWTVLAALLASAAAALLPPALPLSWWSSPAVAARTGVEAGAAAVALPLGAAGVLLAPTGAGATWAAVYLTVAGAAVVAASLLRADRRALAWPGGALLVLASWVRLYDVGVRAPEAYTLPTAAVLLVVGLVRLRRDERASTLHALGPGLTLALLPSLLWALDEPVSWRSLALGLACLGLVVAGVRLRWTAPTVLGATAGALLVVRLAAPYVGEAVPRWLLIGLAGALLVAMGTTWEHRLADARHAMSYLRALR